MEKCVVITGAAGGIGRALVVAFKDAGYRVVGLDKVDRPQDLACEYVQVDLSQFIDDEEYADNVVSMIRAQAGGAGISVLVNNAAVQILDSVSDLSRSDWRTTLNVNLQAPFFLAQALLPELSGNNGSIVNISSIHARLTKARFVAYATSKAALSGMTRAMAVDLGRQVRVNAIEPAAIDTEMLRASFENREEEYQKLQSYHPTGSIGTPESVASLALMIVDLRSSFLNGSIIGIDGGIRSCLMDPSQ